MSLSNEVKAMGFYSYFKQISDIPRESGNEKAISNFLIAFAEKHGLTSHRDESLNVIIEKPASKGRENLSPVFIQAHMDMVCEKKPENTHDFTKDGIEIFEDGDFIYAKGTSLGADNGVGMAMLLQILEDEFEHPAITAIFTVDEERGLVGVTNLNLSPYTGNMLINLDGEEEGVILASCAGGVRCSIELPIKKEPYIKNEKSRELSITITELKGGHSGLEIDQEHANAILLLGRVLYNISKNIKYNLITIKGGNKENSIPANAQAVICFDKEYESEIKKLIAINIREIRTEYIMTDPEINIDVQNVNQVFDAYINKEALKKLLNLLLLIPNGLIKRDTINNASLTSSNIGVLRLENDTILISAMIRSNIDSLKYHVTNQFEELADIIGTKIKLKNDYPAWEYKFDSRLRNHFEAVFEAEFGHKPRVQSIHGGLECAYFAKKKQNIDMISIGCNIYDVHSVHERFSISSAMRTYKYIKTALESLN
jgi:dipeptidase D